MVLAVLALVVAASGTAVAAMTAMSGDSLIKKRSLSGNRLRNHTVTGNQIKLSSLGTVPSATHAATADTATSATHAATADTATNATTAVNATNAATAGAATISRVTYASSTISVFTSGVPAGVLATASCPTGTVVIGGGASIGDTEGGFVDDSYPIGSTQWAANFADGTRPTTGTVTAICAPAAATAP
jgi:hypothetical protein